MCTRRQEVERWKELWENTGSLVEQDALKRGIELHIAVKDCGECRCRWFNALTWMINYRPRLSP